MEAVIGGAPAAFLSGFRECVDWPPSAAVQSAGEGVRTARVLDARDQALGSDEDARNEECECDESHCVTLNWLDALVRQTGQYKPLCSGLTRMSHRKRPVVHAIAPWA